MRKWSAVAGMTAAVLWAAGWAAGAGVLEQFDTELAAMAEKVSKSVVTVTSETRIILNMPPGWAKERTDLSGPRTNASGVIYDGAGHVVTVASSVSPGRKVKVTLSDGRALEAEVVGRDTASNLAVLKVKGEGLTPAEWGRSSDVKPGTLAVAVASSFGMGPSVTVGVVSAVGRSVGGHADLIQITAPVNPGDSGGALANSRGQVVGIVTATLGRSPSSEWLEDFLKDLNERQRREWRWTWPSGVPQGGGSEWSMPQPLTPCDRLPAAGVLDAQAWAFIPQTADVDVQVAYSGGALSIGSQGINYALPADEVKAVADQLIKSGKVARGYLGVSVAVRADDQPGVVVAEVMKGSPAEKAGLRPGDRLLAVGGAKVNSFAQLSRTVARRRPGATVSLTVKRDGETLTLSATLAEQSDVPGAESGEIERPAQPMPLVRPPLLGVRLQPLSKELAEFFGAKEGVGLLITEVLPGSPADKGGLKVGDCIVTVAGQRVADDQALRAVVRQSAGKTVTIEVIRDKKPLTVKVDVPAGPAADLRDRIKELQDLIQSMEESLRRTSGELSRRLQDDLKETIRKLREELADLRRKAGAEGD